MNFAQWFFLKETEDIAHKDDLYEQAIARFIYLTLEKAVQEFFKHNKQKRFSQIVTDAVPYASVKNLGSVAIPENAIIIKVPHEFKVDGQTVKLPDHFRQLDLSIRIRNSEHTGASYGAGVMNIKLPMKDLAAAPSFDKTVDKILARLEYQLEHEATHISSGSTGDKATTINNPFVSGSAKKGTKEYDRAKVDYYTDPGELRAHARQFAVLYKRYFPKQAFDLQKMLSLADHSFKIEMYFRGLTDTPDKAIWDMDTDEFKDALTEAGKRMLALVKYFIDGPDQQKPAVDAQTALRSIIAAARKRTVRFADAPKMLDAIQQMINQRQMAKWEPVFKDYKNKMMKYPDETFSTFNYHLSAFEKLAREIGVTV